MELESDDNPLGLPLADTPDETTRTDSDDETAELLKSISTKLTYIAVVLSVPLVISGLWFFVFLVRSK